jgi:Family of unknown function (DUF6527)
MRPEIVLTHEFVEFVPDELKERKLYVSMKYKTVVHLCCCGCGRQVVTPLAPIQWKLTFDGVSISLWPSIGSWSLSCNSHYIIECNRVRWAGQWSREWIDAGRAAEAQARDEYYGVKPPKADPSPIPVPAPVPTKPAAPPRVGFWKRLWKRLFG